MAFGKYIVIIANHGGKVSWTCNGRWRDEEDIPDFSW